MLQHCLYTPSRQKSSSGRHFLDFAQQEMKEKGFGVNPEIPREFIPWSHSPVCCLLGGLVSVVPPHSLRAGHLQVFCSPQVSTQFSPKNSRFDFSEKLDSAALGPPFCLGAISQSRRTPVLFRWPQSPPFPNAPHLAHFALLLACPLPVWVSMTHRGEWEPSVFFFLSFEPEDSASHRVHCFPSTSQGPGDAKGPNQETSGPVPPGDLTHCRMPM